MRDHERDALKATTHALPPPPMRDAAVPAAQPQRTAQRMAALDTASLVRLQRLAGNQGVVQMLAGDDERSAVHEVVGSGGGQPLDPGTRGTMEAAFGQSFDGVRVHSDSQASKSAESVGANAYTVGSDMVFRSGQYDPGSAAGQRTIAHELSHVVQQSQGPVDGTDAPGGIKVSDPGDRFERAAEHQADTVMSSVGSSAASPVTAGSGAGGAVQREEEGAPPAIQREAAPEEDEEAAPA